MNEQLVSQIQDLGLSEKEARVYLACLSLGPSGVQRIADESGIKRVTTYVILESLVNLGLVSQTTKGKKTMFIAEEATSLKRLLDKKEQELSDQKVQFEALLPQINQLKSMATDSPEVKFYDSAEGISRIVSSFFEEHQHHTKEVFGVSNIDQVDNFFPEIKADMSNPARYKAGFKSYFLYTSAKGPVLKPTDAQRNRESRFIPPEKYPLNADFSIFDDYIVMLSLSGNNPLGITIKSSELSRGMKAMFHLMWDAAEIYNK